LTAAFGTKSKRYKEEKQGKFAMNKKSVEVLVGLFVLLGILGVVFLSLKAANLATFSFNADATTYSLTAKFDNIGWTPSPTRALSSWTSTAACSSLATPRPRS
jgi:hypothetical protein